MNPSSKTSSDHLTITPATCSQGLGASPIDAMAALLLPALDHSTIQARLWAIVGAAVEAALGTRAPRPANDNCDDLLDAIAAGHLLGMTPSALRQAARRGTIRSVKLGRRVRFRRGDLLALGRER